MYLVYCKLNGIVNIRIVHGIRKGGQEIKKIKVTSESGDKLGLTPLPFINFLSLVP
jgi:hypothetical protein